MNSAFDIVSRVMKVYLGKEIEEGISVSKLLYEHFDYHAEQSCDGLSFVTVDEYGGEGQGEDWYRTIKFTFDGEEPVYITFNGYYSSWDGVNFDYGEVWQVEPVEVMVTEYRKI